VLATSQDPWLRSCAAYAIGELKLVRFADVLDRWIADPDPLLRAAAFEARAKLREAATHGAGTGML